MPVATSSTLDVNVTNNGNIALNVLVSKGGTNQSDFTVPASLSVNPGATLALGVTFTPAARGARSANIHLVTNDTNNPALDVAVAGVGQAPQISPSPTSVAFGNVLVGDMSGTTDIVVTNTGELALNVTAATIVTGGTEFTIADAPANTTIAAATSKTWKVVCNPTARGLRNGTLRFVSNSITNATFNIPLTCNGQQAAITIAPTSHTYLPRFVGATDSRTFTITNTGDVPLTTVALDFASATNAFTISTLPSTTLAVNATTTATVIFNPADAGLKSVNLSLTTTEGASATVTLSGQGLDFTVANTNAPLLPTAKRFDDITAAGTLLVTNTSAAAINIGSVTFTPSGVTAAGDLVINPADQSFALGAGATKVVRITLPTPLARMGPSSITG
ncbi:MAG TPA: choice-of-anchor D domain-containing protein, partial [Kofleriaceae bacterium]|nr:choice-of-anchor D domain-containing protein [Kofleriaceae bacterium]